MRASAATGARDATRGFSKAASSALNASDVVVALSTCQHVSAIEERGAENRE